MSTYMIDRLNARWDEKPPLGEWQSLRFQTCMAVARRQVPNPLVQQVGKVMRGLRG